MTPFRRFLLAVILGLAGLLALPIIRACAPEGPSLAFTWSTHPDYPLNGYAKGRLGLLQPAYARSYLVVAYRYLTGVPLTSLEQKGALELWSQRLEGGADLPAVPVAPAGASPVLPDWGKTRARFTREPAPEPLRYQWDGAFYVPDITESALEVAAATLQDRARRWKPGALQAWIRAQDLVFSANGKNRPALPAVPAGEDALFRQDRAYQEACVSFYVGEFAAARAAFTAIARDGASPWRRLAPYLAGRCWLQEGMRLQADQPQEAATSFKAAHKAFQALLQDGLPARPETVAPEPVAEADLMEAITAGEQRTLALGDPLEAGRKMVAQLRKAGGAEAFGDLLGRYTNLIDANCKGESEYGRDRVKPRTVLPGLLDQDLTEWVFRFQETGPEAYALACRRWKERQGLPWLLMALANAEPHAKGVEELLKAAEVIPSQDPVFETIAFHRARLLAAQGRTEEAKSLMGRFLAGATRTPSASARNLWLALRLPLAHNADAFLADALRAPVGSYAFYGSEQGGGSSLATALSGFQAQHPEVRKLLNATQGQQRFLEGDGARILNLQAPTEVLLALARKPGLPAHLRREWTRAAWVRAVLLERWDVAVDATPEVLQLEPDLKPSLGTFTKAAPLEQRRQSLLALLRHPGLRWLVFQGINHRTFTPPGQAPIPLRQRDYFLGACWWPISIWGESATASPVTASSVDWGSTFYYPHPHAMEPPLHALAGQGSLPAPWLTPEQQRRGAEEAKRLLALADAPDWLAEQTLAWAKAAPADPRLPEALHWAVRAGKVGGSKAFGSECFRLLHHRFAKTAWAAATPIHY